MSPRKRQARPVQRPAPGQADGIALLEARVSDKRAVAVLREEELAAERRRLVPVLASQGEAAECVERLRSAVRAALAACTLTGPTGLQPPEDPDAARAIVEGELAGLDAFDASLLVERLVAGIYSEQRAAGDPLRGPRPCSAALERCAPECVVMLGCPCPEARAAHDTRCAVLHLWDQAGPDARGAAFAELDQRREVGAEIDRAVDLGLQTFVAGLRGDPEAASELPPKIEPKRARRAPKLKRPAGDPYEHLTLAAFAARVGCTAPWARKLVRENVLPALADGSLPWARAWTRWAEYQRLMAEWRVAHLDDRRAVAEIRTLRAREAQGELVPAAEARREAAAGLGALRGRLLRLGATVAPLVEHLPAEHRRPVLAAAAEACFAGGAT